MHGGTNFSGPGPSLSSSTLSSGEEANFKHNAESKYAERSHYYWQERALSVLLLLHSETFKPLAMGFVSRQPWRLKCVLWAKNSGKGRREGSQGEGGLPDPCEQTLVQKENCKSICDTLWALSVFPICLGQDWALPPHLNHAMQQGSMCFHGMLVKAMICGMLNPWLGMYNNNENCRLSFTDYLLC